MKIINQTQGNTCLACVCAMLTKQTEYYVVNWFEKTLNKQPPYIDEDAIIYLAHHGIFFTVYADLKQNDKGIDLSIYNDINIEINLKSSWIYLVVDSESIPGLTHSVLWNTKEVLDPLYEEPQKLNKYKVRRAYPLLINEELYERSKS